MVVGEDAGVEHDAAEPGECTTAFHLEQNVLPETFPRQIRYLMARDRNAITAICGIFIRTLFSYQ